MIIETLVNLCVLVMGSTFFSVVVGEDLLTSRSVACYGDFKQGPYSMEWAKFASGICAFPRNHVQTVGVYPTSILLEHPITSQQG